MRLTASEISCGYSNRMVLESISLEVIPGQVLAILGPNGSGKTTLLRTLAGAIPPLAGTVLYGQAKLENVGPATFARAVAMMSQNEAPEWPLTVREAVLLGRTPHRGPFLPWSEEDRSIAEKKINQCGLAELVDRKITELSGGEWRRVVWARTLTQSTPVLLLDEPTSHLDLKYEIELLDEIKHAVRAEDLAVVMTIHDLNLASQYADQFALLSNGRLIGYGTAEQVLQSGYLSEAFQIDLRVVDHPVTGGMLIVPVGASGPRR
jgi:iron complex transport system ATP-binding protein